MTLDQPPSLLEPDFRGWGSRVWQELVSTTGESRGSGSGGLEGGRDPSPPSLPSTATGVNQVLGSPGTELSVYDLGVTHDSGVTPGEARDTAAWRGEAGLK